MSDEMMTEEEYDNFVEQLGQTAVDDIIHDTLVDSWLIWAGYMKEDDE